MIKEISGYTGNLSLDKAITHKGFQDIKVLKNFKKNILAGRITGVTQITSLARKFGLIRPSNMPAHLGFTPSYVTKFASIRQSIGKINIKGIGTAISYFFSDARLKTDIQLVGKSPTGTNIYSFKYKHFDGTYLGVMAQEVPWASEIADNGYYMVDYAKLDVEFRRLN